MSQSQKKRERRALLGDRTIRDSVERLTSYEAQCAGAIPTWAELMDHVRKERRAELAAEVPDGWPDWCLFPTMALHAVIPSPGPVGSPASKMRNALIARMLGLYAWRQGRTVWRFDPDVAAALTDTDDAGHVPAEVLRRLPQWGVYIQRPDEWPYEGPACAGILARLTTQAIFNFEPTRSPVLEIQFDQPGHTGIGLGLSMVPLAPGLALDEALAIVHSKMDTAGSQIAETGEEAAWLRPWLSLLTYLCSQGADTQAIEPAPGPKRSRAPRKATEAVRRVDVGFRVGAAIRSARLAQRSDAATGRTVEPHLRRAHYHTYYTGAGSKTDPTKRRVEVRWLPPIAVGVGDVSPVVRPVDDRSGTAPSG